jgi:glycerophosphoryl diester phosphodiesterase
MAGTPFSTSKSPMVIGHRGVSGHATENSIAAFRMAASTGIHRCDGVELDLQTTLDGHFVVHHDPVLPNGGIIAKLPLSTVRATLLADGSPIPTLAEALVVLAELDVFVEAKSLPPESDADLLALLRDHGLQRLAIHAFDHRVIARLRRADAEIRLGVLSSSYPIDPIRQVLDAGATTLWQEAYLIDAALVAACHREGISLNAWTVNDTLEAHRLAILEVDGLCGNWPERLRLPVA